jgi:OTU domain-containing protein 6
MTAKEDLESNHKKELKRLEGEKRAAVKKAKGTKGKKAKQAVAEVEEKFAAQLKALNLEHERNKKSLEGESPGAQTFSFQTEEDTQQGQIETPDFSEKERKQLKARKKKERQKEREIQRQAEIERENANAGPSLRQLELEQIQSVLTPLRLQVAEVEADGHCLYRAIAAHTSTAFQEISEFLVYSYDVLSLSQKHFLSHTPFFFLKHKGGLCADTIKTKEIDFAPFCEYTSDVLSFEDYVNRVRNSADWGGHLELRALSIALKRPIHIYSVQSGSKPLEINDEGNTNESPIRLSYHLHYFALGEHYNQVIDLS